MIKLRYISIKTQVRKLKYFSVFLGLINDKGSRRDFIERELILWSRNNHDNFENLISPSGEIVAPKNGRTSQSFTNYYEAVKRLNLIDEQSELIIPSREGSVFKALTREFNLSLKDDGYYLTSFEKVFYLLNLYSFDADYLFTTISLLANTPSQPLDYYIKGFQEYYINRIESKMSVITNSERPLLMDSYQRVKNWRSAKRYSEDIVPPRINWLIDLSLIDSSELKSSNKYRLNDRGNLLYSYHFLQFRFGDISDDWIDRHFMTIAEILIKESFKTVFSNWKDLSEEKKDSVATELIDLSYKHFNVLGMPRISLHQFQLFASFYTLFSKNIIAQFNEIVEWIGFEKKIGKKRIGVRNSARKYESYIVLADL